MLKSIAGHLDSQRLLLPAMERMWGWCAGGSGPTTRIIISHPKHRNPCVGMSHRLRPATAAAVQPTQRARLNRWIQSGIEDRSTPFENQPVDPKMHLHASPPSCSSPTFGIVRLVAGGRGVGRARGAVWVARWVDPKQQKATVAHADARTIVGRSILESLPSLCAVCCWRSRFAKQVLTS